MKKYYLIKIEAQLRVGSTIITINKDYKSLIAKDRKISTAINNALKDSSIISIESLNKKGKKFTYSTTMSKIYDKSKLTCLTFKV